MMTLQDNSCTVDRRLLIKRGLLGAAESKENRDMQIKKTFFEPPEQGNVVVKSQWYSWRWWYSGRWIYYNNVDLHIMIVEANRMEAGTGGEDLETRMRTPWRVACAVDDSPISGTLVSSCLQENWLGCSLSWTRPICVALAYPPFYWSPFPNYRRQGVRSIRYYRGFGGGGFGTPVVS